MPSLVLVQHAAAESTVKVETDVSSSVAALQQPLPLPEPPMRCAALRWGWKVGNAPVAESTSSGSNGCLPPAQQHAGHKVAQLHVASGTHSCLCHASM
jgi:hypothetical protein